MLYTRNKKWRFGFGQILEIDIQSDKIIFKKSTGESSVLLSDVISADCKITNKRAWLGAGVTKQRLAHIKTASTTYKFNAGMFTNSQQLIDDLSNHLDLKIKVVPEWKDDIFSFAIIASVLTLSYFAPAIIFIPGIVLGLIIILIYFLLKPQ